MTVAPVEQLMFRVHKQRALTNKYPITSTNEGESTGTRLTESPTKQRVVLHRSHTQKNPTQ